MTIREWVKLYREKGFDVVRLQGKRPLDDDWPNKSFTEEDFTENHNIGLKLINLIDIDIDNEEIATYAGFLLPGTATFGRASKRSSHYIYKCNDEKAEPLRIIGPDGKVLLELRTGKGLQTMVPPSIHPSGEAVEWETSIDDIRTISYEEISKKVKMLAIIQLIRPYYIKGSRQDIALHLSGALRRAGFEREEVLKIVDILSMITGDEEQDKRKDAVYNTYEKDINSITGLNSLRNYIDEKVINTIRKILNSTEERRSSVIWVTADELMKLEAPKPEWLIENILPTGVTLLAGRPKGGKTRLALQLANILSKGTEGSGFKATRSIKVGYIALENPIGNLQLTLQDYINYYNITALENLYITLNFPPFPQAIGELIYFIDTYRAELIVIDTFALLRPDSKKNKDIYAEDYKLIRQLKLLNDRLSCSFLLIHHMRKQMDEDDWLSSVLGSTGLTAGPDTVIGLFKKRNSKEAILKVESRHFPAQEWGLVLNEEGLWELTSAEAIQLSRERQEILKAIDELTEAGERTTPKTIAQYMKKNPATLRVLLMKMVKDGLLEETEGQYRRTRPLPF